MSSLGKGKGNLVSTYNNDYARIDALLVAEEKRIREKRKMTTKYFVMNGVSVHVSYPDNVSMDFTPTFLSNRIADKEFPDGGDPRFRKVLAEMLAIHISKSSDYGTGADVYANYRAAEAVGVPAWKSCFVRALEKVQRLTNFFGGKKMNHEGVEDSLLDLANQIVITKVLYDSEANKPKCGGNCSCKG